jgi:hypothetical protein
MICRRRGVEEEEVVEATARGEARERCSGGAPHHYLLRNSCPGVVLGVRCPTI